LRRLRYRLSIAQANFVRRQISFPTTGARVRPKLARGNLNRVAFLAVLDDVRAQLGAGHAVKHVWKALSDARRISMSYEVFLHYVQRLIGHPPTDQTSASIGTDNRAGAAITARTAPKGLPKAQTTPGAIPGFTFNPTPDIEELF
jgi:hypothetical protein